jgi:hypothetical protein
MGFTVSLPDFAFSYLPLLSSLPLITTFSKLPPITSSMLPPVIF